MREHLYNNLKKLWFHTDEIKLKDDNKKPLFIQINPAFYLQLENNVYIIYNTLNKRITGLIGILIKITAMT